MIQKEKNNKKTNKQQKDHQIKKDCFQNKQLYRNEYQKRPKLRRQKSRIDLVIVVGQQKEINYMIKNQTS
ncbi:unnamed protein product [Paramecium octaurelia]|uniref:Uncharacterized protein n=1 Tax=Paramecium octaurelia TaxID=43137 RepID=A0A8S1WCX2_PAROT|nr:unnamed protein product [Paramecium octaurelia]